MTRFNARACDVFSTGRNGKAKAGGEQLAALNIVIADDHAIVRAGLRVAVTDTLGEAEIREAASMKALRTVLASGPADLLLLDVYFPGLDPEDDLRALRREHPLMAILMVSMLTERSAAERLLRAGANGFVGKSAAPGSLETGLRAVMAGNRPLLLPSAGRGRRATTGDNPVSGLPRRQLEVLQLICLGLSNKEIAKELGLSVSTVRGHVSALLHRLNVPNRASAASYGAAHGALTSAEHTEHR